MGHAGAAPSRGGRETRLRSADVRPDPHCSTCGGSGQFLTEWKPTAVPLPCPRCLGPRGARPLREDRRGVRADVLAG